MTYVVADSCIRCKLTDCVEVCPVDCFHEGPNFLVIDPEECVDCGACVPECPAEAIFELDDVPDDQMHMVEINRILSPFWPQLVEKSDAMEEADLYREKTGKLELLTLTAEEAEAPVAAASASAEALPAAGTVVQPRHQDRYRAARRATPRRP